MRIIVGLGNPGPRYERNRHNIGFMAADAIVRRHGFPAWRSKFQSEMVEGTIGGERVLVLKPQTYMNLSGEAVGAAARFYKVPPADVIVLHDELDLAPGKLRVKRGGGAAGHNGLRSIDGHIGQDYWRVRLGIGHPGAKELVHGYVLQNFPPDEMRAWVEPLVDAVAEAMPLMAGGNEQLFMTKVAAILNPPDPNRQSKRPPTPAAGGGAKGGEG